MATAEQIPGLAPDEQEYARGYVFWEHPVAKWGPPNPDDTVDLAEWLSGYRHAYADYPDDPLHPEEGETVEKSLTRLLGQDHPALPILRALLQPS